MPRRALRCSVELSIHAVTCPGVWLPRRDDVYLSICMFGEVRRTQLTSPVFPLIVQEKFFFDKVFYSAYEPAHVAVALDDEPVVVELIQLSDIYEGGRLLASYECSANNFLYPYPTYTTTYGTQDRDIIMERSLDFPGIAPRLEFSTNTSIKETSAPFVPNYDDEVLRASRSRGLSPRRSRSRTKKAKSPSRLTFSRPTVSSIGRSRSLSPTRRLRMDGLNLESSVRPVGESRPPFKVSKVSKDLIGRVPGSPSPIQNVECSHGTYNYRPRSSSRGRQSAMTDDYLDLYRGNRRPLFSKKLSDSELEDDLESLRITRRYRSPSPVLYRSSMTDRYLDQVAESEAIKARVDAAIERNKARETLAKIELERSLDKMERERQERLERLDRMARLERITDYRYRYPYGSLVYSPYRYDYLYSPYTSTGDVDLDLALARSRRRLLTDL